jgi:hypothetical protein
LDVLAPIDHRGRGKSFLLGDEVVDLLLAAVDFARRGKHEDDVVADRLDEGRLLDRETIGELHQHLGAARFRRVDASRGEVDRLPRGNQLLRLRVGQLARVGQLRRDLLVFVELFDRRLVGNRDRDHVAPLVGHADLEHRDTLRRLVERVEVTCDVLVVRHVPRLARHIAEELQRRRHLVGGRHMVDELGENPRIGGGCLDARRVVGIELLRRRRGALRLRERAGGTGASGEGGGANRGPGEAREPGGSGTCHEVLS